MTLRATCPYCRSEFGFDPAVAATQWPLIAPRWEDGPLAFYPLCRRCGRAVEVPNPGLAPHPPSAGPVAAASRLRVRYSGHHPS